MQHPIPARKKLLAAYLKKTRKTRNQLHKSNYIIKSLLEDLTYMRDFLITYKDDDLLLGYLSKEHYDLNIATLTVAVAEIKAYFENNEIFHWKNFCELFKRNMEGWLQTYDSIQTNYYS